MTTHTELLPCSGCDGTGVLVGHGQDDRDEYSGRCHWCNGSGVWPAAVCPSCDGLHEDFDGLGVLSCWCGWCSHSDHFEDADGTMRCVLCIAEVTRDA